MIIVGAGLAGLLAAHAWPRAEVLEAATGPRASHAALLRFRSDAVSRLTGIEFRRVRVHKGIWSGHRFVEPSIEVANLYSRKVLGVLASDRSIWNTAPVDRYVAPSSLYDRLVEGVGDRIAWGAHADFSLRRGSTPIISTAPMPVVLAALNIVSPGEFRRAAITVDRYRVPACDVFQTVYFPCADTDVYRASITGNLLIVERSTLCYTADEALESVLQPFGLGSVSLEPLDSVHQSYGKIDPLPDAARKELLFRLTHEHNIYSLGRFATWRNVLLDDVVQDIDVIRRLLNSSPYERRRAAS